MPEPAGYLMKKLKRLEKKYLLPLIAAASVLRKEDQFRLLIIEAKKRIIPHTKIYEALLQNYLFAGYPSALVSLKILKEYFPRSKYLGLTDMNLYHFRKTGEKNCKAVYGNKYEKLISNIKNFSPELSSWLVLEGYGKVLGRKGLSIKERECCVVSVLTVMKFEEQLYSHINGAIRVGVSINDIKTIIDNLSVFGKKSYLNFGRKALNKFLTGKKTL